MSHVPYTPSYGRQPSIGPGLYEGTVTAQDPDRRTVTVLLRSGQIVEVQLGNDGPNDGMRVRHGPMPTVSTSGLIAFPHGDIRSGIWLTSVNRNQQDAFTTAPGDAHAVYEAEWGGGFSYRSSAGNFAKQYPDGTNFVVGFGGVVPSLFRHIVTNGQQRVRQAFTAVQRLANAVAALPVVLTHATGAVCSILASGAISLAAATGQTLTLHTSGGTILISGTTIALTPANGTVTINGSLAVTGDISTGTLNSINAHEHTGVQAGGAVTGGPIG